MIYRSRTTFLLTVTALLGACQTIPTGQVLQSELSELPTDASDAEKVVDALARAERAANAGDPVELARHLTRLDALGVQYESEDDLADIARWRSQADLPPPMRGPVGGPAVRRGTLEAGASMEFGQAFLAGERASIAIRARSGPAVHISVADGQATTVCNRRSRRGACEWTPVFTQRHTIRLANDGSEPATYHLAIE